METTNDPIYPATASKSGKNQTYLHCDFYNGRPNYGVCLFIIEAAQENRLTSHECCVRPIKHKTCPAMAMHDEEIAAGRALYYKPRPELTPEQVAALEEKKSQKYVGELPRPKMLNNASYVKGWNRTGRDRSLDLPEPEGQQQYVPPPMKPKRKKAADPDVAFTEMNAGEIVTQMAQEDAQRSKTPSLLDIARGSK